MGLRVPFRRVLLVLMACILALVLLDAMPVFFRRVLGLEVPLFLEQRVGLDFEQNIPTWYSTLLLFVIAVTAFLTYRLGPAPAESNRFGRWFWAGFAAVFTFLSADEAASLHEMLDEMWMKWIYKYAPVAAVLFLACLYYFLWVRSDDRKLAAWIIGGMLLYGLGALGGDYVQYTMHLTSEMERIEKVIEESLELIGASLILLGCLHEFSIRFNKRFSRAPTESGQPSGAA